MQSGSRSAAKKMIAVLMCLMIQTPWIVSADAPQAWDQSEQGQYTPVITVAEAQAREARKNQAPADEPTGMALWDKSQVKDSALSSMDPLDSENSNEPQTAPTPDSQGPSIPDPSSSSSPVSDPAQPSLDSVPTPPADPLEGLTEEEKQYVENALKELESTLDSGGVYGQQEQSYDPSRTNSMGEMIDLIVERFRQTRETPAASHSGPSTAPTPQRDPEAPSMFGPGGRWFLQTYLEARRRVQDQGLHEAMSDLKKLQSLRRDSDEESPSSTLHGIEVFKPTTMLLYQRLAAALAVLTPPRGVHPFMRVMFYQSDPRALAPYADLRQEIRVAREQTQGNRLNDRPSVGKKKSWNAIPFSLKQNHGLDSLDRVIRRLKGGRVENPKPEIRIH